MRLTNSSCLMAAVFLLVTPWAEGGPASRASLVGMCATADAVVVGAVEAIDVNGTVSATIIADRVLKGDISPGASVSFIWMASRNGAQFASPGMSKLKGYGVFFLQRSANSSWSLLPLTVGDAGWEDTYVHLPQSVPESVRNRIATTLPPEASLIDRVSAELVTASESGMFMPYDLLGIFRESHSPVLGAAFSRMLSSGDPRYIALGLRGSVLNGEPSVIPAIRQKYTVLSNTVGWNALLEDIKTLYLNTGPEVVQALGQVAVDESAGIEFRVASAGALARMHTPQTLPYLATLLGEQNASLKTMAVGGLASFANNVPIGKYEPAPGPWKFRTDETIAHSVFDVRAIEARESYYVGFWKNWWLQNQAELSR